MNNDKCLSECKNHHIHEKDYIWNPATCIGKYGKYFASIIDDLVITCDEIIDAEAKSYYEETKTIPANFSQKNAICKTKNFYILLAFLSITVALLIAVSIYCYPIKYKAKQQHLLSYYLTNKILKNFCIIKILQEWRAIMN